MRIMITKSQHGLKEGEVYTAKDYGTFFLALVGTLTYDIDKENCEVLQ